MSQWGEDIENLTSPKNPITFLHWNKLINFYRAHKHQLNKTERKLVTDKSEYYRIYLNNNSCSHIEQHEVKL